MRTLQFVSCVVAAVFVAIGYARVGVANDTADAAAAVAPFVNDDTVAAAYINLSALPKADAANIGRLMSVLPPLGDNAQAALAALQDFGGMVENVRAAGIDAVYLVTGLQDLNARGGPLAIFHLEKTTKPDTALFVLKGLVDVAAGKAAIDVRPYDADIVLVGRATTLDRYAALVKSDRPDLMKPLGRLEDEGAVVAAVVCPGPDARRVVRELWPALPGRLAPLTGEYTDRWLHLEFAVNGPPDAKPRLAMEARDADAAALFAKLYNDLPSVTTEFGHPGEGREKAKGYAQQLVDALPARVEGTRVTIELPTEEARIEKLRSIIAEAADVSMESSWRQQRVIQFKQLALAMHNYHDVNKHFPPAAITDKEGRPVLSWRVAVLPYIDENALYKQFHLDEPWDSPHNRALIEKMPVLFADPSPKLRQLAREGKTTFQVPDGPETIFHDNIGSSYRDVTDGTSKTILIVEVEPQRAAIWTKPEDWQVDLQKPRLGVAQTNRNWFTAAYADGSVSITRADGDEKVLRGMLTRAGNEIVDRP